MSVEDRKYLIGEAPPLQWVDVRHLTFNYAKLEIMILKGKIALITGGATGIGAASTRLLASQGAHVWVASNQTVEEMRRFCDEVTSAGGSVTATTCDITDRAAVRDLIGQIEREHYRLDILVNCAGVIYRTPIFDMVPQHVDRMFAVNVVGAISVVHAALPLMRRSGGGSVINIASSAAVLGVETCAVYSATKAALVHFTRTVAPELRRSGIKINCVAPGSVRTPMLGFLDDTTPLTIEQIESVENRTSVSASPYGEGLMEPIDIAQVVLFLASDASRAFHGACLLADQGITAAMAPAGGKKVHPQR
jgi:NAD(P)-dependent dehydrogenase (short-subunit alcohol dehydrogenase family)